MPRLSVIIPTRERSDTLFHTIRTLVDQDYADCEFLISDNASQDGTLDVVRSFSDPRIRYVNTGSRLSMSDNWEFALGHSRGEILTYIGDDDGFLPGALGKAVRLLDQSRKSALVWEKVVYYWPEHVDEGIRNLFSLRSGNQIRVVRGRQKLAKIMSFRSSSEHHWLPCIYNAIVPRALVEKVRDSSVTGLFFNSIAPDIHSGIVLSMIVGEYLLSEHQFSVGGVSHHSNGLSSFKRNTESANPSTSFLKENSREYDRRLKVAGSVATYVMGEYLLAKESLPTFGFPEPRWDRYIHAVIRSARNSPLADEILESASYTAKTVGLNIRVPARVQMNGNAQPVTTLQGNLIRFKAPVGMVKNVYDACQLISGMLAPPVEGNAGTTLIRSLRNIGACAFSEAKMLYKSL